MSENEKTEKLEYQTEEKIEGLTEPIEGEKDIESEPAQGETVDGGGSPKRKRRIAAGSGTQVSDVNKLLKQFEMMQKMMKQFKKSPKGFARKLGGLMGNPGAFRGMK